MSVELRPKLIGARIKRVEDPRLLTGQGVYVDDRRAVRMLHIAFRRSDYSHARIVNIDTSAAKKIPGVFGVFTHLDIEPIATSVRATSRTKNYHAT
jgi:carbon-monoxide dehydrogenase large subunit